MNRAHDRKTVRPLQHGYRGLRAESSGQAAVEFALVLTVAMIVLFVAIQMALIGQAALALGQANYQATRWAAVNNCSTADDVMNYMIAVGSPTITTNCGSHLTLTLSDVTAGAGAFGVGAGSASCSSPITPACGANTGRTFGDQIKVSVTFDAASQLFLKSPFLGITFPTTLSSTESAMSE
ncbi:MAG: TadE/TadG family type IV pilus assembly protein [Candidatus Binataceae bacterium]